MMKTNTAEVGKRIVCPDGDGVVRQILNPDNVLIELDRKQLNGQPLLARFDLSECKPLEQHNVPIQKEYTEEQLTQPIVAVVPDAPPAPPAAPVEPETSAPVAA